MQTRVSENRSKIKLLSSNPGVSVSLQFIATVTLCNLWATILFKLFDSYLIAFKFAR